MLLSGKKIADRILGELKEEILQVLVKPGLAVILVGDELESQKYVGLKEERAQELGIHFEKHLFPESVSAETIKSVIEELNKRVDIHGIIVQLPLPQTFDTDEIIAAIDPAKDVDGFHPKTLQMFLAGQTNLCPVFPRAILELIQETGVTLQGKRAVAIVNSELFGRILQKALEMIGLEVTVLSGSSDRDKLRPSTQQANVVVTACGIPDLLTAEMLSRDTIVIDGGNVHVDGKVRGDVDRTSVEEKVAWLSPVPGGVGPLTIAFLLKRTVQMALQSTSLRE